jgi:hypothetical protein
MVAQGLKNREIATLLGIGVHVVRNYLSAVYDKIGVSNRLELALWYEARRYEGSLPPTSIGDRAASVRSVGNLPFKY